MEFKEAFGQFVRSTIQNSSTWMAVTCVLAYLRYFAVGYENLAVHE